MDFHDALEWLLYSASDVEKASLRKLLSPPTEAEIKMRHVRDRVQASNEAFARKPIPPGEYTGVIQSVTVAGPERRPVITETMAVKAKAKPGPKPKSAPAGFAPYSKSSKKWWAELQRRKHATSAEPAKATGAKGGYLSTALGALAKRGVLKRRKQIVNGRVEYVYTVEGA